MPLEIAGNMLSTHRHPSAMEPNATRNFVRTYLPWLTAAVMLLLYLITLNKQVTVSSVIPAARAAGIDWQPAYIAPFTWLMTLPVRWMPSTSQVFTLNLIGAIFAVITLALLARSVALLPHDRTEDQRLREQSEQGLLTRMAWLPPVFAVLLLGLQRTFWEHATICTGDIVDVALIAYVIRGLLEFRVSGRDSWLWKAALVYGIGITNNFTFIAFAPAFLVALIWLKRIRFFEFGFLVRLMLFGFAGLSLYLLLPIVQSANSAVDVSFWTALRYNMGYQKQVLLTPELRLRGLWFGGYPILLLLIISIRWPSGFGDTSRVGGIIGSIVAHVLHAALLVFLVAMAFDIPGSPRETGRGMAFLGTYYMSALIAGYFLGYLLVVFKNYTPRGGRRVPAIMGPVNSAVTGLVCLGAIAVPVALVATNWPKVNALNRTEFRAYVRNLVTSIPAGGAVLLSDDQVRLYAAALLGTREQKHILIHTRSLAHSAYWRFLRKTYPEIIKEIPPASERPLPDNYALGLVHQLKQQKDVYYLHPSFGYFFEIFYGEPFKLVHRFQPYPTNSFEAPVVTPEIIARQNEMWNRLTTAELRPLAAEIANRTGEQLSELPDAAFAATYYSQSLNAWAAELIRAGRLGEALPFLDTAIALNADNASALINRESALALQKTGKRLERFSEETEKKLQKTAGIEALLNTYGPVEEPSFRAEMADILARSGLWRQAAQNLLRAQSYAPNDLGYQVGLANIYLGWGRIDDAQRTIAAARAKHPAPSLTPGAAIDLGRAEAGVLLSKDDFPGAEKLLQTLVRQYPEQDGSHLALSQLYLSRWEMLKQGGNTSGAAQALNSALDVAKQHIQQSPQSANAHFNLGNLFMYVPDYDKAIASFSQVLVIDPRNFAALLNRAIANLQARKLDAAERDYEKLQSITQTSFRVYYGLAEIAYQKKDWKAAGENYAKYIKYAPADSEETKFVRARLAELKKK
jgi:tetratricopeptide (TPR) repeat protein